MASQRIRTGCALPLGSLLAVLSVAFPALSADRQARARAAYDEAVRLQKTLEAQLETERQRSDYEKVIRTFREVHRLNPASSKAPAALATIAEIYQEMGQVFSSQRDYLSAAQAYKFVIAQYPYNPLVRDALFSLGEVYRIELRDPEEARKAFQKLLDRYPRSAQAVDARARLREIERSNEGRARPAAPSPVTFERRQALEQVTAIRRWVGPNYTRVVIGLEGQSKFETARLANPDRIVLDLSNTRLSQDLVGKNFPVQDGYLHQIRIAQFRPDTTRVVLDVAKIEDYSVFTLPNPFRLVVDIHGPVTRVAASASAPKPTGFERKQSPTAELSPVPKSVKGDEISKLEPGNERVHGASGKDTREVVSFSSQLPSPAPSTGGSSEEAAARLRTALHSEAGARTLTRVLGLKIGRVVIDPGHGGHDTGTLGPTGLLEKDVVLDVALRLKKLLERNAGSSVVLTRCDDTFIPLEERTAIANEKAADLFVSIHANASRDRSARGVETYYLNFTSNAESLEVAARENATSQESVHQLENLIQKIAMSEKVEESEQFARLVQRQVHDRLAKAGSPQRDRGLKKAPFVVLIGANMPSILAEISFLSNPHDERLLRKGDYRQKIAEALYAGVVRYVNTLGRARLAEQARRSDSPAEPQVH